MSEALKPTYTHVGGFGKSEAGRPVAFGVAVDEYGRELKLQPTGVRVRNAGTKFPLLKITKAEQNITVRVNSDSPDLILVLEFLAETA